MAQSTAFVVGRLTFEDQPSDCRERQDDAKDEAEDAKRHR